MLWAGNGPGAGSYLGPVVPDGFLWVIRSMDFYLPGNQGIDYKLGFNVRNHGTGVVWYGREGPQVLAAIPYRWEGHQVVETADSLVVTTYDANWSWRLSGFVLTLP